MPKREDERTLGLYLHIPFCAHKCDYCDFYSLAGQEQQMDPYLDALLEMLERWSDRARDYSVDSVYIGGGTPSWFGGARIARLLETVRGAYRLAPDCEITAEGNPDSLTPKTLEQLREAGVNRISMGVQSTQDSVLHNIGRIHSARQAQDAFCAARRAGFTNLSVDLIYGLPGQDMAQWRRTVEEILAWGPEHLSCYGLKVEEGTPLWARREQEQLPDDDTQADLYLWMSERLARAGYRHYEISNFARPGRASRHNLKYWLGRPYLGLGPGAYSDFGGCRFGFKRDLAAFCEAAKSGTLPLVEEERPDEMERAREYLMLRLRTDLGVEKAEYETRFALPFYPLEARFARFAAAGWAECRAGRWRLTAEGWLRSNLLIGDLLDAQEGQMPG